MLLTGATGFVGSFLLKTLLTATDADVVCLVRAPDPAAGWRRLGEGLAWDAEPLPSRRITIVTGDLTRDRMGLHAPTFDALSRSVDLVLHAAADANHAAGFARLEAANVAGTRAALHLADAAGARFHLLSSLAVFDACGRTAPVDEDTALDRLPVPEGGYGQSKRAAERLTAQAFSAGLSGAIHRLGRISGDADSGLCQRNDGLWMLIRAGLRFGALPDVDVRIDLTPVDFAARAIVALSQAAPARTPHTFHLHNPRPADMADVARAASRLGRTVTLVPVEQWRQILTTAGRREAADRMLMLIARLVDDTLGTRMPPVDSTRTRDRLGALGLVCPPLDDALLDRYFAYFTRTGFLPADTPALSGTVR